MPKLDVAGLVDGFCTLLDRDFPDLLFTRSGGVLEIRRPVPAVTAIRFELPKTEYLHLASVIIDADGLTDPVRQTTRTMSSVWKDYDSTLASGVIFDPGRREKSFHTGKDGYPWMEIAFDRPRDLTAITVRNCEGPNSLRERGLQVQVRTADRRMITVYDGVARERAFARAAEAYGNGTSTAPWRSVASRLLRRGRPPLHPARAELIKILTMIAVQDDAPVRWALQRAPLEESEVAEFRRVVNERLLYPRERELTSHGIRRSFRFWTDAQKQDYLDFTLEVIAALRELTGNVCLGFGSALAVVRDGEPIPHDDDLDVLIGFDPDQASTHAAGRRLVRERLTAAGFKVTGGMTSYQWVSRPTGGPRLDVFIGVFEGDNISWYPGRRGALTRSMMFPPAQRDFLGRRCPVPARPEDYLAEIYGPGWSVPDPNFTHTWEPQQYADIAGT